MRQRGGDGEEEAWVVEGKVEEERGYVLTRAELP